MDEEYIFKAWTECVWTCWVLAKGERLGELRGKRAKLMDERGLHPYSMAVSQAMLWEKLFPELHHAGFDPVLLRREAQRDAEDEFRLSILEEGLGQGHRNTRRADTGYDGRGGTKPLRDVAF